MFSLRGDAHKFYLQLIKTLKNGESFRSIKGLAEIEEIQKHYRSIQSETLKLVYYRMIKEKNGTGIVPIFVTAVPWFLFLFSKQLQDFLFKEGSTLWILFGIVYFSALIISVVVHFREKAWAAFHIEIIQDILEERNKSTSSKT
jgi:hypothetical protein